MKNEIAYPKTLMIGIDAATWRVIDPLLEKGLLPNLASLMRNGTYGALRSFIEYPSPALWTSISTGKLPEKHGITDFYECSRQNLRAATLYEILEREEHSVGLFRWFATWPPNTDYAFVVPEYTARTPETHPDGLQFLNDLARSSNIKQYFRGGAGLVRNGVNFSIAKQGLQELLFELTRRADEKEIWFRRRLIETEIFGEVFSSLLQQYRPRFAAIMFSVLDDFCHHYWKYREPDFFDDVTEEDQKKYGQVIDMGYIAVDKAIGRILEVVPENTLIAVMSDHGQEPVQPLIRPFRVAVQSLARITGFYDDVWVTDLVFTGLFRPRNPETENRNLDEMAGVFSQIVLEADGREVFTVSKDETSTLKVSVSLEPQTPLSSTALLPDGRQIPLSELVFSRGKISGQHSDRGIFTFTGPGVRRGEEVSGATILDIAPTLLALNGVPIGADMDGGVIVDLIEESFLAQNPIQVIDSHDLELTQNEVSLSDKETQELEDKLRALGYLS